MKTFSAIGISFVLLLSLLLMGCTDFNAPIPGIPFTACQLINKAYDANGNHLNCLDFQAGVYDNNFFSVVDGNIVLMDLNSVIGDVNIPWATLIDFPVGCGVNQAVKIVGSSLVCIDLPVGSVDTNTYTAGIMATDNNRFLIDVNVENGKVVYTNRLDANNEYVLNMDYGSKSLITYDGQEFVAGMRVGGAGINLQGNGIRYTYTTPWSKAVMCINSDCNFRRDLNVGDVIRINGCGTVANYDTIATIVSDNNLTVVQNNFGSGCGNDTTFPTGYVIKYPSFRVIDYLGAEKFKIHPITGSPVFSNTSIALSNGYGIYSNGNFFIDSVGGNTYLYANSILSMFISATGLVSIPTNALYFGSDGSGGAGGGTKTEGVIRGSTNGGSPNGGGTPLNYQVSALGNNTAMYQKWTIGEPTTSGLGAQTQLQRMKLTYNLFDVNVNTVLSRDNLKMLFGTASDASIYYDGTDLNINPKEVGTGKVNVMGDLTVDGNFFGNQIYGGDWNKYDGGFETIDLVTADVYVRATKLGAGALNGFTVADGNLIAQYSGMYQITTTASVQAASGQGEYSMKGFVNDTGQDNCYSHMNLDLVPAVITANPVFSCFVRMNAGDKYNTRFDNHEASVRDIIISSMNTTIVRVGQ